MKFRDTKSNRIILGLISFIIIAQITVSMQWISLPPNTLFYNRSGSMPLGYYLAIPSKNIQKGDLVCIELPKEMESYAIERGWIKPGELLLKKVGAMYGETYEITDRLIQIEGKYVGPVYEQDRKGQTMPVRRGTFTVKKNHFLPVAEQSPTSFDGRYYGDVPMESIITKVIPLVTFGS